jgi:HD-like signal output (HDOD) protein
MNEIGFGVDHMSAMKVIDEITEKGGKNAFLCGVLHRIGYKSLEL